MTPDDSRAPEPLSVEEEALVRAAAVEECRGHFEEEHVRFIPPCGAAVGDAARWFERYRAAARLPEPTPQRWASYRSAYHSEHGDWCGSPDDPCPMDYAATIARLEDEIAALRATRESVVPVGLDVEALAEVLAQHQERHSGRYVYLTDNGHLASPRELAEVIATEYAARLSAPSTPDGGLDVELLEGALSFLKAEVVKESWPSGWEPVPLADLAAAYRMLDAPVTFAAAHPQDPPETEKVR